LVKGVAQAGDIAAEDLKVMFDTNVTGLINMTQAILPIFKKRSDGGRGDIINIGSIAGREPYSGGSIYCATKAAVRSFTDAMRKELIATRIRVIEIDPGQVETVWLFTLIPIRLHKLMPVAGVLRCPILWRQVQGRRCLQVSQTLPPSMRLVLIASRGVEPLTGDDIAEVVVFAAGRRENVVIADTLVFPSHQVSFRYHIDVSDEP
jgi:3-hydroxy acid dehydrogenase/malonic semialdehyde reductase